MGLFEHIRTVPERDKSVAVKKLIEESTPNFDFFFLIILAILMATFGMLENSPAVVIASMLIAPILFPILSLSLSVVMSDYKLIRRATSTLVRAAILSVATAFFATLFFGWGGSALTAEVLARTQPTLISVAIAIVSGFAVAYALANPKLDETFPGIVVAVALIPPLAAIGIGLASFNWGVVAGATLFLMVNVVGIVFASMIVFSLMNLYVKRTVAAKTADTADKKAEEEAEAVRKKVEAEEASQS